MRLGGATSDATGRPTICLDVAVSAGFGVESCGTGQAIIHDDPGREMAHFRATYTFLSRTTDRGVGKLRAGVGFAELQVGQVHPGFKFGVAAFAKADEIVIPQSTVQPFASFEVGVGW